MKYSIYKKLSFALALLGAFSLFSCGGSSGGDEEEFEFKPSDLTNKYWYANPFLSGDYKRDDALIVYRFEGGNVLKKQEFSGRRDEVVGEWSLIDNQLIIEDESIDPNNRQEWFIQSNSKSNYLKLNSSNGSREFYTDIDAINDITADAYVVNELRLVNGSYESDYKMEYAVYGDQLSQVKVLPDESTSFDLDAFADFRGEKVYYLKESDRDHYFENFTGNQTVKFVVKADGENYKLKDQLYMPGIKALDNFSTTATHASQSGTVSINWKAIDEDNIYYYIEILDKNKNEYLPKFRSTRQTASAGEEKEIEINASTANELQTLSELEVGEDYYVKISGFKYEDDIHPDNSSNKEINIQAVTRYVFKAGVW